MTTKIVGSPNFSVCDCSRTAQAERLLLGSADRFWRFLSIGGRVPAPHTPIIANRYNMLCVMDQIARLSRIEVVVGALRSATNERKDEIAVNKQFFENLLPGTVLFQRFELVRCLSAGDAGAVYLCKSQVDKQIYALKVLANQMLRDPELVKQFRYEVELSLSIRHPNVVRALDFFWDETFVAFSMEYVSGGTVGDLLESKEPLPLGRVMALLSQIASGLAAIHDRQIVHRDLKPENILLDSAGNAKITDFGIAAAQSASSAPDMDKLAGTVNYLSPEYVSKGIFDERSDIYAFGIIAYELLTGKAPFIGAGLIDTLVRRVQFDPKSPRELRGDIPRALSDLTLKAMHRSPEKRYQTARELLSHLELIRVVGDAVMLPRQFKPREAPGAASQRPAARLPRVAA